MAFGVGYVHPLAGALDQTCAGPVTPGTIASVRLIGVRGEADDLGERAALEAWQGAFIRTG